MKLEHPDRLMNRTPLSLAALEVHDAFAERHIGPDSADQHAMLEALGFASRAALIDAVIPKTIRRTETLPLGPFAQPKSEAEALAALRELADKNQVFRSYIGQGYYNAHTPTVILRNVLENPAWYTAYTPYQPEISQGRLEALLNFQQMIVDLTGLAISNASLLDEATAAAEAMTLLQRVGKPKSNVFYVADDVLPQTIEVVKTRATPVGIEVKVGPAAEAANANAFGVLLQYPGVNGDVRDYRALADAIHAAGGHVVVAADLLALTVLTPPGEWGADVAVGNTQRFGVPVGFGGPHAAYLAVRDEFKRQMPGRLVGVTVDAQGNPALRLALQTREQHIRREKATSNVCTAQALLAIMASMYAVYHGPHGLKTIALRVNRIAALLAAGAKKLGYTLVNDTFFDTLTFETGARTQALHDAATAKRINLRRVSDTRVGISIDETTKRSDLADLLAAFAQAAFVDEVPQIDALDAELPAENTVPAALERTSAYLTHHVFNRHHSETEMLRYLRSLSDKDLALDRSMIPLGSCTMKLNATSEMLPVTWPEFGPHPPVRAGRADRRLPRDDRPARSRCSSRPPATRSRLAAAERGRTGRICGPADHPRLPRIARRSPSQRVPHPRVRARNQPGVRAHGRHAGRGRRLRRARATSISPTCRSEGRSARRQSRGDHDHEPVDARRVRGQNVREICEIVHAHGGQVYVDGANMNAMVGLTAPGQFGGDPCLAPESAGQDLLHSARRRRTGRRSGRGRCASRAIPAESDFVGL